MLFAFSITSVLSWITSIFEFFNYFSILFSISSGLLYYLGKELANLFEGLVTVSRNAVILLNL